MLPSPLIYCTQTISHIDTAHSESDLRIPLGLWPLRQDTGLVLSVRRWEQPPGLLIAALLCLGHHMVKIIGQLY